MANEVHTQLTGVEDAVDFLESQGFQINHIDGIYRVRKEGWEKRPYELDAETLIQQANEAVRKLKEAIQ